jgi:hypothetical protein
MTQLYTIRGATQPQIENSQKTELTRTSNECTGQGKDVASQTVMS